jgi:hypothetical protein
MRVLPISANREGDPSPVEPLRLASGAADLRCPLWNSLGQVRRQRRMAGRRAGGPGGEPGGQPR